MRKIMYSRYLHGLCDFTGINLTELLSVYLQHFLDYADVVLFHLTAVLKAALSFEIMCPPHEPRALPCRLRLL